MTARERKLLRKEINFKLKYMANKESKENDFYNSSQIVTERQQMYMTISKYFRTQDNRRRTKQLPFVVERTSLPHVNLSLLTRLYDSTKDTLKSSEFDKVLSAHSFRTATPFYTNPALTVDRGKVMNYSAHVGAVLHTPRYIDFLKNTPEYSSTVKHQQNGSEKRQQVSRSESSDSSTAVLSQYSDSSSMKDQSRSKNSSIRSQSRQSIVSEATLRESKTNSRRVSNQNAQNSENGKRLSKSSTIKSSNKEVYEDNSFFENSSPIKSGDVPSRSSSVASRSNKEVDHQNSVPIRVDNVDIPTRSGSRMSSEKVESIIDKDFFDSKTNNPNEPSQLPESDPKQIKDDAHSTFSSENEEETSNSSSSTTIIDENQEIPPASSSGYQTKVGLDRQNAVEEDNKLLEDNDIDKGSSDSINKGENVELDYDSLIKDCEHFFNDRKLKKEDLSTIKRYFETVDKYKINNPDYVNQFGLFLGKNNSAHFTDFQGILTRYGISNISDEDAEYIKDLIDKYDLLRESSPSSTNADVPSNKVDTDTELVEGDGISSAENDEMNGNILRTIQRVFPMKEIMENYDIKIEAESDEDNNVNSKDNEDDFAEAFTRLFRNSITTMNSNDLDNLKKLINQYDVRNESTNETIDEESGFFNRFNDLFMTKKDKMNGDDLRSLSRIINNESPMEINEEIECFKILIDEYKESIIDDEEDKIRNLVHEEEMRRERRLSRDGDMEENEDNEMMMAFRNLFRSSVGEIKKAHLEHIQRIITEHE